MTFHVFVVDIIMFAKRFVVSRHCIFDKKLVWWVMVGAMLSHGWHNVG